MSAVGGGVSAVFFDLAGVLMNDPFRLMAEVATDHGFDLAEFGAIAVGRGDYAAGDHPWHLLERGEIELDDYNRAIDEIARARGHDGFPPLPLERIVGGAMEVRPEMLALAADLRAAGVATGIVTNNVRALAVWRDQADWDGLFDVVIDSCEVGMRKPEARIFLHACAALGVEPSAAVFVDDMQANVDGAIAAGMKAAVLVREPAVAIEEIRQLVG